MSQEIQYVMLYMKVCFISSSAYLCFHGVADGCLVEVLPAGLKSPHLCIMEMSKYLFSLLLCINCGMNAITFKLFLVTKCAGRLCDGSISDAIFSYHSGQMFKTSPVGVLRFMPIYAI